MHERKQLKGGHPTHGARRQSHQVAIPDVDGHVGLERCFPPFINLADPPLLLLSASAGPPRGVRNADRRTFMSTHQATSAPWAFVTWKR